MFVRSLPVYPVALEGFVVSLSTRPTKRLEEHRIVLEVCSTFRDAEESALSKVFKTRDLPGVKSRILVARVNGRSASCAGRASNSTRVRLQFTTRWELGPCRSFRRHSRDPRRPRLRHRAALFHGPPGINYRYTPTYVLVESHGASLKYAPSANALCYVARVAPCRFISNLPRSRGCLPRAFVSSLLSR